MRDKTNGPVQIVVIPQPVRGNGVFVLINLISEAQPRVRQRGVHVHSIVPVQDQQFRYEIPGLLAKSGPPFLVMPLPSSFPDFREGFPVVGAAEWGVAAE